MVFNSFTFAVFLAVVLLVHARLGAQAKKAWLLAASYVFYGAWNPPFVVLLVLSTAVDWVAARRLYEARTARARRFWLWVSLASNLGLLGYFKYGAFALRNFVALMGALGVEYSPPEPNIVLPVGISFYTFQTLSYTLDIYRGRLTPARSLLDFSLFVAFFPQLVAGPIVRAADFLPQLLTARRVTGAHLGFGVFLLTLGLFEKNVLADELLASTADSVFGSPGPTSAFDTWLGVIAFAGQIFCDFAGYSTCAIGVAICLGYALPDNFRSPYAAVGFRDFWRRWHMSLSTWLRDYLYISLGGSRGTRLRTAWALFATMLLGGLWHGASWNFVVWGALHGLFLVAERALSSRFGDRPFVRTRPVRLLLGSATFVGVCIAWVFFRATDLPRAGMHVAAMLGVIPAAPILPSIAVFKTVVVMAAIVLTHVAMRNTTLERVVDATPSWLLGASWAGMLFALVLTQGGGDAFIYFQF